MLMLLIGFIYVIKYIFSRKYVEKYFPTSLLMWQSAFRRMAAGLWFSGLGYLGQRPSPLRLFNGLPDATEASKFTVLVTNVISGSNWLHHLGPGLCFPMSSFRARFKGVVYHKQSFIVEGRSSPKQSGCASWTCILISSSILRCYQA